jgi:hypothetical protein
LFVASILKTRDHKVSENASVSVLRWGRGETYCVGSLRANLGYWILRNPTEYVFPPHLRTETDPVSETLWSLVPRIPDDGQILKSQ